MKRCLIFVLILLLPAVMAASEPTTYTGSLTSSGLNGTGIWVNNIQNDPGWSAPSIAWNVSQLQDGWWSYNYVLSVYQGAISHFILEVSPTFSTSNIRETSGAFNTYSLSTHQTGPGNPNMPNSIYGIKFDETQGLTLAISFESDRAPVWGDFYAKDGKVDGVTNTLWNAGFGDTDWTSPTQAYNAMDNHILVPDSMTTTPVPEPSSMIAGLALLSGVLGFKRRRS